MIGAGYASGIHVENSRATRATVSAFEENFYLYQTQRKVVEGNTISTTNTRNKAIHSTGGKYTVKNASDGVVYWDDIDGHAAELDLIGIHPMTSQAPTTVAGISSFPWTVETIQSGTGYVASDLHISTRTESYTLDKQKKSQVPTLAFEHVLSKVTIQLKSGTGFTVDDFEPTKVTLLNMNTTANVTVADGATAAVSIGTLTGDAPITPIKTGETTADNVKTITYEAIVMPGQTFAKEVEFVEFQIKLDESINPYRARIPNENFSFQQGKNHKFTITVHKVTTDVVATITDWADGTPIQNEEVKIGIVECEHDGSTSTLEPDNDSRLFINLDGQHGQYIKTAKETWKPIDILYLDHVTPRPGLFGDVLLIAEERTDEQVEQNDVNVESIYIGKTKEIDENYQLLHLHDLYHPFSKINITIQSDSKAPDGVDLSDAETVTLNGLKEYQSINLISQVITYGTANASQTLTAPDTDNDLHKIECAPIYVKPGSIAAKALLLTVHHEDDNGVVNDYKLNNENSVFKFEAGKEYNITVTLKKTEITYAVTITDWTKGRDDFTGDGTI